MRREPANEPRGLTAGEAGRVKKTYERHDPDYGHAVIVNRACTLWLRRRGLLAPTDATLPQRLNFGRGRALEFERDEESEARP